MSSQKQLHTSLLIATFLLSYNFTNAQGSEKAIATSVITALLAGGLILFLIVMPIVVRLSRKRNESPEENEIDPALAGSNESETGPYEDDSDSGGLLIKGCVTLILCLIAGAMIVSMMFK